MYHITPPTTKVAGNELGLFEDYASYYSQTDLDIYFETIAT